MSGTVKKELVEKPVSDKLEQIMHDRENFMSDDNKEIISIFQMKLKMNIIRRL